MSAFDFLKVRRGLLEGTAESRDLAREIAIQFFRAGGHRERRAQRDIGCIALLIGFPSRNHVHAQNVVINHCNREQDSPIPENRQKFGEHAHLLSSVVNYFRRRRSFSAALRIRAQMLEFTGSEETWPVARLMNPP